MRQCLPLQPISIISALLRATDLRFLLILATGLFWLLPAPAQTYPRARLEVLTPPGAQAGTTVEVALKGTDLDEIKALYFSDARIKAEMVPPPEPKIDPKTKKPLPNQPPPPMKFKVTVPGDVPVGVYDARAIGRWGISNPRAFAVGDLKEIEEKEPNNDVAQAQKVEMNTTINGIISAPTDVDYFSFAAKKGQRVVVHCAASEIDSKLNPLIEVYSARGRLVDFNRNYQDQNAVADCVIPEDGDYLIRLCQFAYIGGGVDHFYRLTITTGPWIDAAYPPVVEPGKQTSVTLYGRNLPGGQPDPTVTLNGRPLEKAVVQVNPPVGAMAEPGLSFSGMLLPRSGTLNGFEYRVKGPTGLSNPVLLTYTRDPVVLDNGNNHQAEEMRGLPFVNAVGGYPGALVPYMSPKGQNVTVPCTICGKLEQMGDRDWYTFNAKKGDVYIVEGIADRLGLPVNLFFQIRRAYKGQQLATIDSDPEVPDVLGQFAVFNKDPKGRFVVPEDGTYQVMVSSYTARPGSGPRLTYRLNIRKEQPGFRLILVANDNANAGAFLLHKGGCQVMNVVVVREDGFDGEILLEADGLPKGVTCQPQVIGPKLHEAALIVESAADAADAEGPITVKGTATINGQKVARAAQSGVLVWPVPNGIPAISRLSRSTCLAVRDKGVYTLSTETKELTVPVGGQVDIKVKAQRLLPSFKEQIQLVRVAAPAGPNGKFVNVPQVNIAPGKDLADVKFQIPGNTPTGTYTLAFQGRAKFNYVDPKDAKKKKNVDVHETTPPIKITVYNQVAELTVANPKMTVKAGEQVDVTVKVKRLYDYKGEFQVQLVIPPGIAGIGAVQGKIPAGADEVKLTLKTAKNATVSTNPNYTVKATAKVGNVNLNQETKFELTVTKATAANVPTAAHAIRVAGLSDVRIPAAVMTRW
jgi:hypothetical protein